MTDVDAIRMVAHQIKTATTFAQVFGPAPKGDPVLQKKALRKQFVYLARLVHPDHAPKGAEKEAAEVFDLLNRTRQSAEAAIESDAYETPFKSGTSPVTNTTDEYGSEIQSSLGFYRLAKDPFRFGDFSILYRGRFVSGDDTPILAKVARDPMSNGWLEKESILLKQLKDAKAGDLLSGIGKCLPNLLDTFFVSGEKGTRYRVNIYTYVPGMVSVADIMVAYPKGLEAAQAVWVARRVFAQTLAASMLGVVQGAITPDHLLVEPFTHEPIHIGWPHAVKVGERVTHIIDRWKDMYPPEIFAKKEVDHRTDIYMAGATIVKMMGGSVERKLLPASVPSEVSRIILRCLEEAPARRPQDGKLLLDEFTRVIRSQWGRMYRPLTMPIH